MSKRVKTSLTSGVLASVATSLCCVVPLALLILGVSGAWIGNLTALKPYSPIFITIALVALFFAYRSIFITKDSCHPESGVCTTSSVNQTYKIAFFIVATLVFLSIIAPDLIVYFYLSE